MHEPDPQPAQELFTPEALRRTGSDATAPTRPGEASPAKPSRSSTAKSPGKMSGKLRRCCLSLGLVPWLALLSLALLVGGITIFAIKGMPAAHAATTMLSTLGSATGTGFPMYMHVYEVSVWATVGVAGAAAALLLVAACVRLDLKFRRSGKYEKQKGPYGVWAFRFFTFLSWLGLLLTVLLALWMVVNGVLLSSWAVQCWNLEKGADTTSANIASLETLGGQYTKALDGFAASVMAAAGGSALAPVPAPAPAVAPAPEVAQVEAAPPPQVPSPSPLSPPPPKPNPASPPPAAKASPPPPVPAITAMPTPAGNATEVQMRAMITGTPAAPSAALTGTSAALNASLASGLATLKNYAANWTASASPEPVQQAEGLCPSAACLNMALYPFTESAACVCSQAGATSLSDQAHAASETAVWVLIGVAALFCGALLGCMEATKDHVLLSADQLFLTVMRRKSRRTTSGSASRGSLKAEDSQAGTGHYQALSPIPTLPMRQQTNPAFSMMARG